MVLLNSNTDKKRFEEYPIVECDNCTHYWDNSCDGLSESQERVCETFLATRRINSLEKIKWLESALIRARKACVILGVVSGVNLLLLLLHLMGVM